MQSKRILVVDDEAFLLMTLVANLELEGFDVVGAAGANEALALLEESNFDLMVSDIRMPGINGVDLLERVRKSHPAMPVLLMTGFAIEDLIDRAIKVGAFTVLPKPFEVDHLIRAIAIALKKPIVLVVDDEEPVAETTVALLEEMGIRAVAVFEGEAALEAAQQESVDVCVVDMVMPGLDGASTVAELLKVDSSIVCIAISGHDVPDLFRRAGPFVFAILRKPVRSEVLAHTISRARAHRAAAKT